VQAGEPARLVQHAEHERCEGGADAGDAAQGIGRVELAVERLDLTAESGELRFDQAQAVDHHATVVQISGESYRLQGKRKEGMVPKAATAHCAGG
jgi:hypothetical protein